MQNLTEFVIEADGTVTRRDITNRRVIVTPQMITALSAGSFSPISGLGIIPQGPISAMVSSNGAQMALTVPLKEITLRTNYLMEGDFLIPNFGGNTGAAMELKWVPFMPVKFTSWIQYRISHARWETSNTWLHAFDDRGSAYRLPLPNLYDDCKICLGEGNAFVARTAIEAFRQTLERFETSNWNTDLLDGRAAQSKEFFRFKAGEHGAFVQQPVLNQWPTYCQKVAHNNLKFVL